MTTPMPDLDKLARGLTDAETQALLTRSGTHAVVTSQRVEPLWFAITKHSPEHFTINLNDDGLALRAHIERTTHAD